MRLLVDAQLPRRMTRWFGSAGHDAVHTLDLPKGNRALDSELLTLAETEQRVVVTKDSDFVNSFLLSGKPPKLLLISTGNSSNRALESLVVPLIPTIAGEFASHSFIELLQSGLVIHS